MTGNVFSNDDLMKSLGLARDSKLGQRLKLADENVNILSMLLDDIKETYSKICVDACIQVRIWRCFERSLRKS